MPLFSIELTIPTMNTLTITLIAVSLLINRISSTENDDFVKNSCRVTRYPDICYETLSTYATSIDNSSMQLANMAVNVTLRSAQLTANAIQRMSRAELLKPREAAAMKDCVENVQDSVSELQQAFLTMVELKGPEYYMRMSDIQTWVSTALTDEDTCMDSVKESAMNNKTQRAVSGTVTRLFQLTSNALALINELN